MHDTKKHALTVNHPWLPMWQVHDMNHLLPVQEGWLSSSGSLSAKDPDTLEVSFDKFWVDFGSTKLRPTLAEGDTPLLMGLPKAAVSACYNQHSLLKLGDPTRTQSLIRLRSAGLKWTQWTQLHLLVWEIKPACLLSVKAMQLPVRQCATLCRRLKDRGCRRL